MYSIDTKRFSHRARSGRATSPLVYPRGLRHSGFVTTRTEHALQPPTCAGEGDGDGDVTLVVEPAAATCPACARPACTLASLPHRPHRLGRSLRRVSVIGTKHHPTHVSPLITSRSSSVSPPPTELFERPTGQQQVVGEERTSRVADSSSALRMAWRGGGGDGSHVSSQVKPRVSHGLDLLHHGRRSLLAVSVHQRLLRQLCYRLGKRCQLRVGGSTRRGHQISLTRSCPIQARTRTNGGQGEERRGSIEVPRPGLGWRSA
jgi:hypothetical protein